MIKIGYKFNVRKFSFSVLTFKNNIQNINFYISNFSMNLLSIEIAFFKCMIDKERNLTWLLRPCLIINSNMFDNYKINRKDFV